MMARRLSIIRTLAGLIGTATSVAGQSVPVGDSALASLLAPEIMNIANGRLISIDSRVPCWGRSCDSTGGWKTDWNQGFLDVLASVTEATFGPTEGVVNCSDQQRRCEISGGTRTVHLIIGFLNWESGSGVLGVKAYSNAPSSRAGYDIIDYRMEVSRFAVGWTIGDFEIVGQT